MPRKEAARSLLTDRMLTCMDPPLAVPALLERARRGDRAAFEAAIERVRPRAEAFIESRLGQELRSFIEPGDVLQETLLRALRSLDELAAPDEDSLFRWLAGIAHHVILEAARRRQRDRLAPLDVEPPGTGTSPEARARRQERFERLQSALDALPPDHREVILLARIDRLPLKEVGARMGRSTEAATQLLWRALQGLRRGIDTTGSFGLPDRRLERGGGAQ